MAKIFTPDCRDCKWCNKSSMGREFDECDNAIIATRYGIP
jgi:hypothetical protein